MSTFPKVCYFDGFGPSNLDFLQELPNVKRVGNGNLDFDDEVIQDHLWP